MNWLTNYTKLKIRKKFHIFPRNRRKNKFFFAFNKAFPLIDETSSKLPELIDFLQASIKHAEPKFLQLGQDLQSVYSDSHELARQTVETAQMLGGKSEDNILNNISGIVGEALSELQSCESRLSNCMQSIKDGSEHLKNLYNLCKIIEKTAMSLNVIGFNIAVESSRSRQSLKMFTVFIQEIREITINILEISQNIRDHAYSERSHQMLAHNQVSEGIAHLCKLKDDADKTVKNSIREISHLMELLVEVFKKAGFHSQNISNQISEIVMAIQFQDIAKQKIEHIVSSLRDLESICNEKIPNLDPDAVLGRAYSILSLQAAQLEHVIAEINGAHQKINSAFEDIESEADLLANNMSAQTLQGTTKSQIEIPLKTLKANLEHLDQLSIQGNELGCQMIQTAIQTSKTASHLSQYVNQVRGISIDLHLKALNAIVKTAHLNDKGKTLDVLAQEVTKISNESEIFVNQVVEILQSINALARNLKNQSWEKRTQMSKDKKSKTPLQIGIDQISTAYKKLRMNSTTTLQQSYTVKKTIEHIRSDLCFFTELNDRLKKCLNQINGMAKLLETWSAQKDLKIQNEIDLASHRYTMQSERSIHNRILKETNESMVSDETNCCHTSSKAKNTLDRNSGVQSKTLFENAQEDDDLGDNVELF